MQRLTGHVPLEGDVIDAIVARRLSENAIVPVAEKVKKIEDAWRASRWEIAVAWRISSAGGSSGADDFSDDTWDQATNDDFSDARAAADDRFVASKSAAYASWAAQRAVGRKRVFTYFIPAAPLFEAAQRRLAIQCGFGRGSVFHTDAMRDILRKAGCSVSQVHERRREIFLFEARVAELRAKEARTQERAMLMGELARRAPAPGHAGGDGGSGGGVGSTRGFGGYAGGESMHHQHGGGSSSAAYSFEGATFAEMSGARRGAVSLGTSNDRDKSDAAEVVDRDRDRDFDTDDESGNNASVAIASGSFRLPPRPAGYDEGEYTAIQHVLAHDAAESPRDAGGSRAGSRRGGRQQQRATGATAQAGRSMSPALRQYEKAAREAVNQLARARVQRRPFGANPSPPWITSEWARRPTQPAGVAESAAREEARHRAHHMSPRDVTAFGNSTCRSAVPDNNKRATQHDGADDASQPRLRRSNSIVLLTEQRKSALRRGIPLPWLVRDSPGEDV